MTTTEHRLGGDGPVRVTARAVRDRGSAGREHPADRVLRLAELAVLALFTAAILVAALVDDDFGAARAWTLVTVLAAAYIVSRGLAKLGRGRDELVGPER
jgi:hypothetical protein